MESGPVLGVLVAAVLSLSRHGWTQVPVLNEGLLRVESEAHRLALFAQAGRYSPLSPAVTMKSTTLRAMVSNSSSLASIPARWRRVPSSQNITKP